MILSAQRHVVVCDYDESERRLQHQCDQCVYAKYQGEAFFVQLFRKRRTAKMDELIRHVRAIGDDQRLPGDSYREMINHAK